VGVTRGLDSARALTPHVLSRRSVIAASSALVLAGAVANASKASALTSTTQTVWVFGDSIAKGGWLADPQQGWSFVLQRAAAAQGITVTDYSVGGIAMHHPGSTNLALPWIQSVFTQQGTVPDTAIVSLGTNDCSCHQLDAPKGSPQDLFYTINAALNVDSYLKSKGVKRVVWNTVYPFGMHAPTWFNTSGTPAGWVPLLNGRADYINGWLNAMWAGQGRILNTNSALRDWPAVAKGADKYFLDGMHPTTEGHARIAAEIFLSAL
jgi:lysophospholipase L1-like esterase